jgi:hypothetical protein
MVQWWLNKPLIELNLNVIESAGDKMAPWGTPVHLSAITKPL